ncbi:hypothetical protein RSOLAG1IB_10255 [Rhizoctonia solani AG-1 IB]|uniref:Uncharacterized protein n=1 Tax=Thanatephorus cucumeris (strain AG1-IB / isolate 7/3/14) TaxID=1108050 RepID=A0A0B7FWT8_THACB|nr:hypothetical protein RSOLAG1IB_10255 [Rhizoctonia solani AG-1 IB]
MCGTSSETHRKYDEAPTATELPTHTWSIVISSVLALGIHYRFQKFAHMATVSNSPGDTQGNPNCDPSEPTDVTTDRALEWYKA